MFGARLSGVHDPILEAWDGVEVYHVSSIGDHGGPQIRTVRPHGELPDTSGDYLDEPNPPIISAGGMTTVGGVEVEVAYRAGGFEVTFGPGSPALAPPTSPTASACLPG